MDGLGSKDKIRIIPGNGNCLASSFLSCLEVQFARHAHGLLGAVDGGHADVLQQPLADVLLSLDGGGGFSDIQLMPNDTGLYEHSFSRSYVVV